MLPIIKSIIFRTADGMNSLSVQINQRQIFRVITCGIAWKAFMIHLYPVPFEILIMLYLLHGTGIFLFVPIVSPDNLKCPVPRKTFTFHIQDQIFIL